MVWTPLIVHTSTAFEEETCLFKKNKLKKIELPFKNDSQTWHRSHLAASWFKYSVFKKQSFLKPTQASI